MPRTVARTCSELVRRERRALRASGRAHSIPRPVRRRYADAPAGAPRCAPAAPSGGSTALPARFEVRAPGSLLDF
jgi:hypothetical protein